MRERRRARFRRAPGGRARARSACAYPSAHRSCRARPDRASPARRADGRRIPLRPAAMRVCPAPFRSAMAAAARPRALDVGRTGTDEEKENAEQAGARKLQPHDVPVSPAHDACRAHHLVFLLSGRLCASARHVAPVRQMRVNADENVALSHGRIRIIAVTSGERFRAVPLTGQPHCGTLLSRRLPLWPNPFRMDGFLYFPQKLARVFLSLGSGFSLTSLPPRWWWRRQ